MEVQTGTRKDWGGNKRTMGVTLGASNHSDKEREVNDFYATNPKTLEIFLDRIEQDGIKLHHVWECACGQGHLARVLQQRGLLLLSTDLVDRGYGQGGVDFLADDLSNERATYGGDILTNPPYKYAEEFVERAMTLLEDKNKLVLLLKIQFLEGQKRKGLFEKYPPKYVYINSSRQLCAMNGEFEKYTATALCYCWFVWEKGYLGEPIIRWI